MKNPFSLYVIAAMALIALSYNVLASDCEMTEDTQARLEEICESPQLSSVPRNLGKASEQDQCKKIISKEGYCITDAELNLCEQEINLGNGLKCLKRKRKQGDAAQLCGQIGFPRYKEVCFVIIANKTIEPELIEKCSNQPSDEYVLSCLDPNWGNIN